MRSAGDNGKGEERKETPLFSLFLSSPRPLFSISIFLSISDFLLLFYEGASVKERDVRVRYVMDDGPISCSGKYLGYTHPA